MGWAENGLVYLFSKARQEVRGPKRRAGLGLGGR